MSDDDNSSDHRCIVIQEAPEDYSTSNTLATDLDLLASLDLKASLIISAECFGGMAPVDLESEKQQQPESAADDEESQLSESATQQPNQKEDIVSTEPAQAQAPAIQHEKPRTFSLENRSKSDNFARPTEKPEWVVIEPPHQPQIMSVLSIPKPPLGNNVNVVLPRKVSFDYSSSETDEYIENQGSTKSDYAHIRYDLEPQRQYLLKSSELFIPVTLSIIPFTKYQLKVL